MRTSSTGGRLLLSHVVMVLVITTALSGAFAMHFIPPVKKLPSELGGSSSSSSSSSLNLYGIKGKCDWVLSKVNITRIAPQTGHVLNTVFDTSHFCQPTVTVPATDPKSETAFLVGYHRYSSFDAWDTPVLSVLDFTNPDRPAEVQKIALPASSSVFVSYTYSNVHYDPVGNNAWVIAQTIDQVDPFDNDQFLIRVDLTQGVAYNVTSLPIATYNTQGALNVKTRKLYIPLGLGMIEYNIDTNSLAFWNSYITIMAMGWDSWTSATYALYVREDSKGQNVTYGILEPNTGALQDIKQYSSEYSSSGTMVVDSTAGLSYVALSTGQRQDFVVFETQSGNVRSLTAVQPDDAMNQYLFGL